VDNQSHEIATLRHAISDYQGRLESTKRDHALATQALDHESTLHRATLKSLERESTSHEADKMSLEKERIYMQEFLCWLDRLVAHPEDNSHPSKMWRERKAEIGGENESEEVQEVSCQDENLLNGLTKGRLNVLRLRAIGDSECDMID